MKLRRTTAACLSGLICVAIVSAASAQSPTDPLPAPSATTYTCNPRSSNVRASAVELATGMRGPQVIFIWHDRTLDDVKRDGTAWLGTTQAGTVRVRFNEAARIATVHNTLSSATLHFDCDLNSRVGVGADGKLDVKPAK